MPRSLFARGFLVLLFLGAGHVAAAHEKGSSPPRTNLDIMQSLIGQITREVIDHSDIPAGDTVAVRESSGEDSWIVEHAVASALRASGYSVLMPPDSIPPAGYRLRILSAALRVRYDDMFHDGFLGAKKVRRTVSASVACDVMNARTHEVSYSGSPSLDSADTVLVDDIPGLELSSSKSTRAELPAESFLDRVLEPLVIIGATGVSIYLFFHVRS